MLDADFASVLWPALRRMGWAVASGLFGRPQARAASAEAHAAALAAAGAPGQAAAHALEARSAASSDGFFAAEFEVR
jgi:hypothetical protein